jgi:hypothetical protein
MSPRPIARPACLLRPPLGTRIAPGIAARIATGIAAGMIAALAALAALAAATPAAATPYDNGEPVQFKGVVSDPEGRPVPGVQVVLEAARRYLSLRQLRRAEKDVRRVSATTDARGQYTIEWPWDAYFNHLEILAGVTVRHGREESFEVSEREDVSGRVLEGSPVVSAIVIHNRGRVERLRDFVASVQTADQRRVYEEMGVPDDVKRVEVAGHREEAEVSWWYFAAGKICRFRAGRLDQVERFDPVQGF